MKWKLTAKEEGLRTFLLVFTTGDEIVSELAHFAKEQNVSSAHFTAIGACQHVTLGFFDVKKKDYEKIQIDEQVEVISLAGNVAMHAGEPKIHAHMIIGTRDFTAHGGHLFEGTVRPTLELFLTELPVKVQRARDAVTSLPLIDLTGGD